MKPLKFLGSSRQDLKAFPEDARGSAGHELNKVQCGKEPSDWKPMLAVGPGVREIRVHFRGEWRVIYVATLPEAVYVLHAFQKKERKTSLQDIELARQRYRRIGETS